MATIVIRIAIASKLVTIGISDKYCINAIRA